MKGFIVFLGLLLVGVWAVGYQGDMGRFIHAQMFLKAEAEECAAGAALQLSEEAFSEGRIEFDRAAGQEYADAHLAHSMKRFHGIRVNGYNCRLTFEGRAVTAKITLMTEDIFKLPFLTVTEVTRESRYELQGM